MIITAEGGTDGANIILFWPAHLPDGADKAIDENPIELVEKLENEGKLVWFPCDGDGSYTLAVYIKAAIPDELRTLCKESKKNFTVVAKSDGYFGGMEGIFKESTAAAASLGCMEKVEIPDGTYRASLFTTDFSAVSDLLKPWIIKHAGFWAYWVSNLYSVGCAFSFFAVLAAIVTFIFVPGYRTWWSIPPVSILIVINVLVTKTAAYKKSTPVGARFQTCVSKLRNRVGLVLIL